MPRTILICGSPADGFQIVGLFADSHDAQSYAEDYSLRDWWIAELTSPEAFAESQRRRFRALRGPRKIRKGPGLGIWRISWQLAVCACAGKAHRARAAYPPMARGGRRPVAHHSGSCFRKREARHVV